MTKVRQRTLENLVPKLTSNAPLALEKAGGDPSGWYIPPWTPALDDEANRKLGVQIAILSVTAPGPSIERYSTPTAALARSCN